MATIGAALDPQVRGQLRSVSLTCAIVLVVFFAYAWFSLVDGSGSAFLVAMAGMIAMPLIALIAIGTIIIHAVEGRRVARKPDLPAAQARAALWAAPLAGLALFALAPLVSQVGRWGRRQVLFNELSPSFKSMIAAHHRGIAGPDVRFRGRSLTMEVEATVPKRFYFELGGIADNGSGFVYDPTDAVLAARGFDADHQLTAPPEIREFFGGDLVRCTRVRGHYHYCGLT